MARQGKGAPGGVDKKVISINGTQTLLSAKGRGGGAGLRPDIKMIKPLVWQDVKSDFEKWVKGLKDIS